MAIKHTPKFYEDNLVKHQCLDCEGQFILGEDTTKFKSKGIKCPYCYSDNIDYNIARKSLRDINMGCMGIYYEPK